MGRATLKEVTARKATTCRTCQTPIQPGTKYWKLESFRQQAKFCQQHKPSDEQVRHFAPMSRADRASEAADSARDAASELNDIQNDAEELAKEVEEMLDAIDVDEKSSAAVKALANDQEEAEAKLREGVKELSERVANISYDLSEVESLAEEMGNWRDGMSGTNLENSNKYSEVDDCAGELEGIDTEPASIPSLDPNASIDDLHAFVEECEEVSGQLESATDDIEGISFPGMY
jgi:DNA repair exonuclease SbcCD ATPase subunit